MDRTNRSALRRCLTLLMMVVVGLAAGAAAAPAPALAACGSACDGVNPQVPGGKTSVCAEDARTIYHVGAVQLRYSPNCRTAWARQTANFGWLTGVQVESFYLNGNRRMIQTDRTTGASWSRMVNDANLLARACFYQYDNERDQANDRRNVIRCTRKY